MTKATERCLLELVEVESVVSKTGRPEIANDPMGVYQTDVFVKLKPHAHWRPGITKTALIQEMQERLKEQVPANSFSFTQPIELRECRSWSLACARYWLELVW